MASTLTARGGQILIECLKAQGVRAWFGMPGTQNNLIYDALAQHGAGIDHYLVRHEYSCSFMADGYARASGEVAVAVTVPGPGATNASTGILNALNDCVPVLLLVGQSDQKLDARAPSKIFHGMDGTKVFESITRLAARATSPEQIPALIAQAFGIFRSGRPGPVMIELPSDVLMAGATVELPERVAPVRTAIDAAAIQSAAEALLTATRPVIFAGGGVNDAGANAELRALVAALGAPVITTRRGKGALSEDHPLALSNINGFAAAQAWAQADCVLSLGVRFTSIDTRGWTLQLPAIHVQFDCDARELGREYPIAVGVVGDVKRALGELVARVAGDAQCERIAASWREPLATIRAAAAQRPSPPLLTELRELLPRNGVLVCDVNSIGYRSFAEYPVYDPRTFYYPCIAVSLGAAVGAAIGAKIARPEAPVVCFVGDGGFLMGAMELAMARQYGINFVTIVTNDGALSAIKGSQSASCQGRWIDVELHNPDLVAFAESFGLRAERVSDLARFPEAVRAALAADGPSLIEVPLHDRQAEIIREIPWLDPEWLKAL